VFVVGEKVADALLPPLLLHEYVAPPLAVIVALCPSQIVTEAGAMEAVGLAFTVTVTVFEVTVPQLPVITTEYVPASFDVILFSFSVSLLVPTF
jgi:hypothetical protein